MTAEVYQVSLEDMMEGIDPLKRGDKPLLEVEPGKMSQRALVRINPNGQKSLLTLYCEEDNSETKVYKVNPKAYLTVYGRLGKRRLLVVESDEKPFAFVHETTIFPDAPVFIRVEDEIKNRGWLMLIHR